jgi:hypothetical protein
MCVVVMRMRGLDVVCVVNAHVYRCVSFITFLQPSKYGMFVQQFGVRRFEKSIYTRVLSVDMKHVLNGLVYLKCVVMCECVVFLR